MHHYFISEVFIVLAGIYGIWKLSGHKQYFAAAGIALFTIAAAIGVYRFGTGNIKPLASLHFTAGQLGGMTGMALIAVQLGANQSGKNGLMAGLLITALSLLLALVKPAVAVPLFLSWGVAVVIGAYLSGVGKSKLKYALGAALMLFAVIFLRRSSLLEPDISWHAFHTVVAIWVMAMAWILTPKEL